MALRTISITLRGICRLRGRFGFGFTNPGANSREKEQRDHDSEGLRVTVDLSEITGFI